MAVVGVNFGKNLGNIRFVGGMTDFFEEGGEQAGDLGGVGFVGDNKRDHGVAVYIRKSTFLRVKPCRKTP
jgi:hypothetical protein